MAKSKVEVKALMSAGEKSKLVASVIKADVDGFSTSGSAMLDAVTKLASLHSLNKASEQDGIDFALEYDAKWRTAMGKPKGECNKSVYGGVAACVRVGKKKWHAEFFKLMAAMHRDAPLSYTMIRALGRRASKLGNDKAPDMAWLKKQRADVLKKAEGTGTSGPRKMSDTARIDGMLRMLKGWRVPDKARAHLDRIRQEVTTLKGIVAKKAD